jgi:spore germination protein
MRSTIPNTKVFDFDIDFFAPGLDPITPLIKLGTTDVEITGCALFSGDKMVGKLNRDQTIMLLGMMGETKNTDFALSDPELKTDNPSKYGIAVILKKPKRKIKIDFDEAGKPNVNISLSYKCLLDEYRWDETDNAKQQQKIEKIMGEQMQKLCTQVIAELQQTNSDPIGIGNIVRAKYSKYWNSIDWNEVYKDAAIKVSVKVDITEEGIIK